ncbi:formate dehydrogenase subunit delta [Terrihabitans soli]|uniref:Formate dehydrogenase subunit delta n=1 Tax=Terrihabitans soli TaxID=708113 RepID=A0A6S6QSM7_9HYPH|nr:formate dehydrogenase subunit delta [Terrihabitans soli]BCJ90061.1 formate dehydrogenase subunit delta [Terrihabitans soli]
MAGDNTKTLVRMANQIADFFAPYSGEQCVSGVQTHIKKFWSPVMRRDLAAHIEHGGEGLRPAVIEAFHRMTQSQTASPTHKGVPSPSETGQMASDAG